MLEAHSARGPQHDLGHHSAHPNLTLIKPYTLDPNPSLTLGPTA